MILQLSTPPPVIPNRSEESPGEADRAPREEIHSKLARSPVNEFALRAGVLSSGSE